MREQLYLMGSIESLPDPGPGIIYHQTYFLFMIHAPGHGLAELSGISGCDQPTHATMAQ